MTFATAAATIIKATAQGAATNAPISVPGLQVGDVLFKVEPYGFPPGQALESVVSAAGQLTQLVNLDWSTVNFTFYLLRGV